MRLDELLNRADDSLAETAELLSELIRIPTINAGPDGPGSESALCRHLAAKLARDGVEGQILESMPERGNLVARLGSGRGPRLLYMSHTDVVPVEDARDWRYGPFEGKVADGCVWGRGAADCKSLVAAEAMALLVLARSGVPLSGELIYAAAADEETGGKHGFGYLVRERPELVRADYAVNEGGGALFSLGKRSGYIINTGEKGRLEAEMRIRGRGGHAAAPWEADSPIERLGDVLGRLRLIKPMPDLSHPIYEATREVLRSDAGRILRKDYDKAGRGERGLISALRGAAYMTLTPTMVSGGVKSNAIPPSCTLTCDVRTLPGQDRAHVERELAAALTGIGGVEIVLVETAEPSASPYPTPFSEALQRATARAVGREDLLWLPGLTAGFTDSRFVRRLGATVYGFAPRSLNPETGCPEGVHGRDERMPIESLHVLLRTLVSLAWGALGPGT